MATVQIRNLSEDARRTLKARAALDGKSLSEYLRLELERLADQPTIEEMVERVSKDPPVGGPGAAELIRAAREEREEELYRRTRGR